MDYQDECIICLDDISREKGDYRTDVCSHCNYIVHIHCYEQYIQHMGKDLCVVCNKDTSCISSDIIHILQEPNHSTIVRQPIQYNNTVIAQPIPNINYRNNSNKIRVLALMIFLFVTLLIFLYIFKAF